jgi:amidohydrolase
MGIDTTLAAEALDLMDSSIRLRREIHKFPELGLSLPRTQEVLLDALQGIGVQGEASKTVSGITAMIDGGHDGPTILLRADMDALPLHEDTEVDFNSTVDGAMHACGHDIHVSMLVGAAQLLQARRKELHGRVLLMFQPGEEGFHGAKHMLDEGMLDNAGDVNRAFALHVSTAGPTGSVSLRAGSLMASSDTFRIVVKGRGGHASAPHLALDPIPVACEIVQALQLMITRRIDAFDPSVLTVGQIVAGTTSNVIPETATILGTVRAVSERTRTKVNDSISRVAENIAMAHEATASVEVTYGYPVTVNDNHVAAEVHRVTDELFGEKYSNKMANPVMGAEDWSYVLQQVPGAMAFLGATPKGIDPRTVANNHSNLVRFDEGCMSTGIALYAAMALDHLKSS